MGTVVVMKKTYLLLSSYFSFQNLSSILGYYYFNIISNTNCCNYFDAYLKIKCINTGINR